jgi:hypothetical protein
MTLRLTLGGSDALEYVRRMVGWTMRLAGPLGLLPFAFPLVVLLASRLGSLAFPDSPRVDRVLGGVTLALGLFELGIRLFGSLGLLYTGPLFMALLVATLASYGLRRQARLDLDLRPVLTWVTVAPSVVMAGGLGLVALAAALLPVWQWDAIGYHLPFVAFALQGHGFAEVPRDALYLSSYPHNVEVLFLAFRAMLPDDRLVEWAHVPLGVIGALATLGIAREAGARTENAWLAGLAWLGVPVVFLQLATNYVDVASASLFLLAVYWVMHAPSRRGVVCAGVALGLYLGSKPNAPLATAVLFLFLLARARVGGGGSSPYGPCLVATLAVLLLGAESYVTNMLEHGNPSWPVAMHLGPLVLPGKTTVTALLAAGAAAPRTHGPWPLRLLESWTAIASAPVFDMRVGGFGVPFLLALPAAVWVTVRQWRKGWWVAMAASLASPEPSTARFVLAFPALVLALATVALGPLGLRARVAVGLALAGILAATFVYAEPGFVGEGPPLLAYLSMSPAERLRAVGANGRPTPLIDAREALGPGESAAFDAAFDLPYLLWAPDLSRRVFRIGDDTDPAGVDGLIREHNVRLLVAGDSRSAGLLARSLPDRFFPLFRCKSDPCTVFRVR